MKVKELIEIMKDISQKLGKNTEVWVDIGAIPDWRLNKVLGKKFQTDYTAITQVNNKLVLLLNCKIEKENERKK